MTGVQTCALPIYECQKLNKVYYKYMTTGMPFISLPNRLAEQSIIPEMRGVLTPAMVAEKICQMLDQPEEIAEMSEKLLKLTRQEHKPSVQLMDTLLAGLA